MCIELYQVQNLSMFSKLWVVNVAFTDIAEYFNEQSNP